MIATPRDDIPCVTVLRLDARFRAQNFCNALMLKQRDAAAV
jgi:hypothetical protein